MRTMFFHAIACETDDHPWLVPAGNIGEKCSVGRFFLVRTAHPTAGGAVLRRLLLICSPISQPHGWHGSGSAGICARQRSGASRHEKSAGRIVRAVGCAVRTMFFHAIACETDDHPWLVPAGNIEENCSVGGFSLVRTAHPTVGGAVLRGLLPISMPISPAWVARQWFG